MDQQPFVAALVAVLVVVTRLPRVLLGKRCETSQTIEKCLWGRSIELAQSNSGTGVR